MPAASFNGEVTEEEQANILRYFGVRCSRIFTYKTQLEATKLRCRQRLELFFEVATEIHHGRKMRQPPTNCREQWKICAAPPISWQHVHQVWAWLIKHRTRLSALKSMAGKDIEKGHLFILYYRMRQCSRLWPRTYNIVRVQPVEAGYGRKWSNENHFEKIKWQTHGGHAAPAGPTPKKSQTEGGTSQSMPQCNADHQGATPWHCQRRKGV